VTALTDIYTPEFFAEHRQTVMMSASVVAPLVKHMLDPQSILDIGCGEGEWLEAFAIEDSFGVDIAAIEGYGYIRHDLTVPLALGRGFDLVVSLETAEHLPESAADTYAESIALHADDAVLFSAAVPGQEGLHHVNCQPHEYWHEKFAGLGLEVTDPIRPLIAHNHYVSPWYRNNIFVYRR
jgi:SAM-dependent methyltransferase